MRARDREEVRFGRRLLLLAVACGVSLVGLVSVLPRAEASWLDWSFGDHGKVSGRTFGMDWEGSPDWGVKAVATDRRGRITFAGGLGVARLSAAGVPDPEFGEAGVMDWLRFMPDYLDKLDLGFPLPRAVIPLSNGKTILAGQTLDDWGSVEVPFMIRLNEDGSLDRGFGRRGLVRPNRYEATFGDAARDRHGRIVTVGSKGSAAVVVSRFTPNGVLDQSFGEQGALRIDLRGRNAGHMLTSVRVLSSGRILAAGAIGSRPVIVAIKASGRVDRRFGRKGFAWGPRVPRQDCGMDHSEYCVAGHLARLSDGRFVLGADLTRDRWRSVLGALTAFRPDGQRARGYGHRGVVWLQKGLVERGTNRPARSAMDVRAVVPLSRGRIFVFGGRWTKGGDRKVGILIDRTGRVIRVRRPVFQGPENWYDGRYTWFSGTAAPQPNGRVLVAAWENSPDHTKEDPRQNVALYRLNIPR